MRFSSSPYESALTAASFSMIVLMYSWSPIHLASGPPAGSLRYAFGLFSCRPVPPRPRVGPTPRPHLFHRDTLGQVTRFIDIAAPQQSDVIGKQLKRYRR